MRERGAGLGERRLNDAPARIGGIAVAPMLVGGVGEMMRICIFSQNEAHDVGRVRVDKPWIKRQYPVELADTDIVLGRAREGQKECDGKYKKRRHVGGRVTEIGELGPNEGLYAWNGGQIQRRLACTASQWSCSFSVYFHGVIRCLAS